VFGGRTADWPKDAVDARYTRDDRLISSRIKETRPLHLKVNRR
jgi:hypothetical protein